MSQVQHWTLGASEEIQDLKDKTWFLPPKNLNRLRKAPTERNNDIMMVILPLNL